MARSSAGESSKVSDFSSDRVSGFFLLSSRFGFAGIVAS
jgi:hypothetical protein